MMDAGRMAIPELGRAFATALAAELRAVGVNLYYTPCSISTRPQRIR